MLEFALLLCFCLLTSLLQQPSLPRSLVLLVLLTLQEPAHFLPSLLTGIARDSLPDDGFMRFDLSMSELEQIVSEVCRRYGKHDDKDGDVVIKGSAVVGANEVDLDEDDYQHDHSHRWPFQVLKTDH